MNGYSEQLETLLELEHRHEELLQQLDDLDKRVEKVLVEWQGFREFTPPGGVRNG